MTERSASHATFVIERRFTASPAQVFAAWADPVAKKRWFGGDAGWEERHYELDFRVGGREYNSARRTGGQRHIYEARYQDIIPDTRIIATYDLHLDATRISVSLMTVEFKPDGTGTRLVFTEQGVFLDGHDIADQRQMGTEWLLDALAADLERNAG
ncbi:MULTISPECIES: SRPBCC family protein [Rhodomicrobium]|uniref:SRPBCC family protein n=1 Tax=Rhodomicrobium TaxID=1068 RepID=UPI000B4B993A|nr:MULTISPECIES: SRPBCC family protein [Rhodomicrobium]